MKLYEAIEKGFIAKEIRSLVDTSTCEYCGNELEISTGMSNIYCSNIHCSMNLALRLVSFLDILIDVYIPIEKSIEFIRSNSINKLSDIFYVQEFEDEYMEECMEEITLNNKDIPLYKIIEAMSIQELMGIENKLFFNYNSIEDFYTDLKIGGIVYICSRLGYTNEDEVISVSIYNALMRYENDIIDMCSNFELSGKDRRIVRVCTDSLSVSDINSSLSQINRILTNILLVVSNILMINTDLIIIGNNDSERYNQANRLNANIRKNNPIKCMTSIEELVDYIQKL